MHLRHLNPLMSNHDCHRLTKWLGYITPAAKISNTTRHNMMLALLNVSMRTLDCCPATGQVCGAAADDHSMPNAA